MGARRKHDHYPTLPDLCREIVRRVGIYFPQPRRIVEPTAGDGPFVRALRAHYGDAVGITAVDVLDARDDGGLNSEDCRAAGATRFLHADFLSLDVSMAGEALFIGNPPFTLAAKIVRKIRAQAPQATVAFLLPVSFWGRTQERDDEFWRLVEPRYFAPIHPRPSFTGNGKTDRMEYGLFGFGGYWEDAPRLGPPVVFTRAEAKVEAA